ncbi:hypothetical protein OO007_10940 [Cocleimonas sp. KMM 6892]|uniref:hypothetical protein n=1 Tax=unclassified Cocleimonas TaxID=2639732 RepID=UPI002DBC30A0|nr:MULTISPECIES: hypothetical protein [unclassified Cocleimonas]MEB8432744.1 hypothetical protein [Cocleimonas sp. KMM 6892]MEC4715603.1 hypothetical protein [Cocleimonas sp. KMM 6895]MEC4744779.1 hypothetical protein [Cocleimonas sp. KMM 6896]
MRLIIFSLCLVLASTLHANTLESGTKKHIPISMGINLNEPQSQVNIVTTAQIMADLAKTFRPFDESIFNRVKERLETKGVDAVDFVSQDPEVKNIFVDEYIDHENGQLYTISRDLSDDQKEKEAFSLSPYKELSDFKIRGLVNRFAQKRYRRFSEFGITVNKDKTVILKKGSYVYTRGLESAIVGDVPNGVYPLYFKGDVEVDVEGFATFVDCPEKYTTANKCLDIQIPETPSVDGIKLTFTANSDTYLRDFHLILPTVNHEDVLNGKIVFNPDYLKYIKPFSTFRVMNMMISSPKAPFECVTTYVKTTDVYSLPKQALEAEYLRHQVKIRLLEIINQADLPLADNESLKIEALLKNFKEFRNEDNEIFYTEDELDKIEPILGELLAQDDFLNIMTLEYRIQQNKDALEPLKEKLAVLRQKSLEYNWNYVSPNEDYGNCLMKFARTPENRAQLNDQFWGNSYITPEERWRGLPYEVIVALINETKANVWVNIPHNASIDYVTEMSKYFNDNLNKDSRIFIELSNEVWNGGFASQKYFTGLAKYRYEYYVTEFLDQFEHYLKTSDDKVVTYRNLRKSYLTHFNRYKKEITQELDTFKSCKKQDELATLVNGLRFISDGKSISEIETFISTAYDSKTSILNEKIDYKLKDTGLNVDKITQALSRKAKASDCETYVENDYLGNDEFIQAIKYKKGNFFEKLARQIPEMSAYWLGYTGAAKGKLKIQVEDKEGNYKDTLVDRFKYTKENKNELHSPDLVYHYSGNEIRDLQEKLFIDFKEGWNKRALSRKPFDFNMNAKVYVLKNLDRAYQTMAQMAYVDRLDQIAKIWIDSGIDEKKLIFTLATKQNNPNLTQSMLEYAVKKKSIQRVDAIATPAYFFGCFGDLKVKDEIIKPYKFGPCKGISKGVLNAETAEEIIDILKDPKNPKGVEAIRAEMIAHKAVINKSDKRIQLVAYEGGHHLAIANLGRNQRKYFDSHPELKVEKLALFKDAIESIGMGEITKDLYKVWLEEDGKQFNNFYMPQSFHEWGSLGLSLSLSDMKTPRYLAADEYARIYEIKESARKAATKKP